MRQTIIILFLVTLLLAFIAPSVEAKKEGVPGRRIGGGTRWSAPRIKQAVTPRSKLNAMAFASRNRLPLQLKLKAIYG